MYIQDLGAIRKNRKGRETQTTSTITGMQVYTPALKAKNQIASIW